MTDLANDSLIKCELNLAKDVLEICVKTGNNGEEGTLSGYLAGHDKLRKP